MTSDTTLPPADAGQLDQAVRPASEARWYCVGRNGIATLCADQQDAKSVAFESDAQWPREAPHRAVQLVDIAALAAERERCAKVCEEVATWAGSTWRKAGLDCAEWVRKEPNVGIEPTSRRTEG